MLLSRSLGVPSRKNGPPNIWDTTWYIGKRFCKSNSVFFSTLSAKVESMEFWCMRTHITTCDEWKPHQFRIRDASQDRQPEIHSTLMREIFHRIMVQTNNDCRFQIFIFDKFTTPATFACWKIRFKTEVCTCSQFPMEATLWIKEVELVDSVDDLKSSCSIRGVRKNRFWSARREDRFSTEPNPP